MYHLELIVYWLDDIVLQVHVHRFVMNGTVEHELVVAAKYVPHCVVLWMVGFELSILFVAEHKGGKDIFNKLETEP